MQNTPRAPRRQAFRRHPLAHTVSLLIAGLLPLHSAVVQADTHTVITGQTITSSTESVPTLSVSAGNSLDISNSQVSSTGKNAAALNVVNGTVTGTDLTLQTDGLNAQAVQASEGSHLTLTHTDITTNGDGAVGAQATNSGTVIRLDGGTITSNGDTSYGTHSENGGQIVLNGVTLSTSGYSAIGASVYLGSSVQLLGSNLSTQGVEAHGVMLLGQDKDNRAVTEISNSQIATQGDAAIGLNVNDHAQATVQNSLITTAGDNADAVWLTGASTEASLSGVNIVTSGDGSKGISSQGGYARLENVTLTTRGNQAHGLYSDGATAQIDAKGFHITLDKLGAGAFAVDGGTINLDTGSVTAHSGGIGLLAASGGQLFATHTTVNAHDSGGRALMLSGGGRLGLDDVQASATGAKGIALLANASAADQLNTAELLGTGLTALQGTAIAVRGGHLDLTLDTVHANAQQLLDVDVNALASGSIAHGTVTVNASNSTLLGDIRVAAGGTGPASLHLRDSSLTGAIKGLDQLDVLGTSRWTLTADSTLGDLHNTGVVAFQPGTGFKTLTIEGDLTGSGTFAMNTQVADPRGDLLRIEGTHSGSHTLAIADSGREPSAANGELMLVDGNGGDGHFALVGRPHVDVGAYRYSLLQQGDDWFLRNTSLAPIDQQDSLSDGSNIALGSQTAAATLWSAEMNALVKRLGELRMGEDNGGLWTRAIGKTYEVDTAHSRGFEQAVHGMEIGADTAIPLSGSTLYVGGMLGMATSTQHFGEGGKGEIDSQLLGAYATWLNEDGYYVDNVVKYNRMKNDVQNQANTGEQVKGRYTTRGYAADIEVGRHIPLGDGWFVEPQGEVTYTHTGGADYTASNGLNVQASDAESLQGRVGSLFGRTWTLRSGMPFQPYVKASYVHEFAGASSVKVNGHKLANQIAGSRAEYGVGGVLQVSDHTKLSLDIQQAKGDQVEEPWALNFGVRYLW